MGILDQLRRLRAEMSREQFTELHPHAFLIPASNRLRAELITLPRGKPRPKSTLSGSRPHDHLDITLSGPISDETTSGLMEASAFPLRKAAGNPFPDRISIGRAPGCDVVLSDASVSKLHGHFHDVRRDTVEYTDAKSANKTYIDGVPALPGVSVEIRSSGMIAFGRVRLQLLSSADFYDWL